MGGRNAQFRHLAEERPELSSLRDKESVQKSPLSLSKRVDQRKVDGSQIFVKYSTMHWAQLQFFQLLFGGSIVEVVKTRFQKMRPPFTQAKDRNKCATFQPNPPFKNATH